MLVRKDRTRGMNHYYGEPCMASGREGIRKRLNLGSATHGCLLHIHSHIHQGICEIIRTQELRQRPGGAMLGA
jgi:hypothetical protein